MERREWQIWLGALLFMLAVLIGLAVVTPGAKNSQLPFILLGFIVAAFPVSRVLRKSRQALKNARQELLRAMVGFEGAEGFSLVDPVTGLLNRNYLDNYAHKELGVAERTGLSLTFLMIGLQHLKSQVLVPEPAATDSLLIALADLLRANFRDSDTLIRLGNREYLVLMLGCKEPRACEAAERLLGKVDCWNREKAGNRCEMILTYTTAAYVSGTEITSVLDRLRQQLMLPGPN